MPPQNDRRCGWLGPKRKHAVRGSAIHHQMSARFMSSSRAAAAAAALPQLPQLPRSRLLLRGLQPRTHQKKSIRHVSVNSQCPARHLISEHRNSLLCCSALSISLSHPPFLSFLTPLTSFLFHSPSLSPLSLSFSLSATNVPCCVTRRVGSLVWHLPLHVDIWEEFWASFGSSFDSGNSIDDDDDDDNRDDELHLDAEIRGQY